MEIAFRDASLPTARSTIAETVSNKRIEQCVNKYSRTPLKYLMINR